MKQKLGVTTLRGTAVNEFYRMIRMGVAGHVRGNRTETNE